MNNKSQSAICASGAIFMLSFKGEQHKRERFESVSLIVPHAAHMMTFIVTQFSKRLCVKKKSFCIKFSYFRIEKN